MIKKILAFTLFIAFIFVLSLSLFGCGNNTDTSLESDASKIDVNVDILRIGKADCIIVNTGSKILMIDTGEVESVPYINSFMEEKGYNKIDTLVITHFDKDHLGGALEIIPKYHVSNVIQSSFSEKTVLYENYLFVLESEGVTPLKLNENYTLNLNGCQIEIDVPKSQKYKKNQDNNSSLVVSVDCGERKFLFTGDAMELRLSELIDERIGEYDFIKLPHHGNYLENYREFLESTKPSYAAITCSNKNPPDDKTLALLEEYGVEAFETRNGNIHIHTDGKTIEISY